MNCYSCGAEQTEGSWCNCQDYEYEDYQYKEQYDITDHIAEILYDYQKGILSAVATTEALKEIGVDNLEIIRLLREKAPSETSI